MTVNLVLADDAALGGVVGALSGLGSQILSLQKSEPSLEDVFVELVGRGFGDEDTGNGTGSGNGTGRPPADDRHDTLQADDTATTDDTAEAEVS